jgi:hypothetical protein
MTLARKLELACGGVIGLLAVAIFISWVRAEYAISVELNSPSDISGLIPNFIFFILCPCLLVAYGSFLHAIKQRDLGKVLLVIGCFFIIGYFLYNCFHRGIKKSVNSSSMVYGYCYFDRFICRRKAKQKSYFAAVILRLC